MCSGLLFGSSEAHADIGRFDLAGRLYTKWLYQNDDTQGVLTHGNPFPAGDNYSGANGVGSEFELKISGSVSNAVRAEVRLKSRFGALWHDWWENGDLSGGAADTSGESLGMNHAEYIKLRGYAIDANLPIPSVRSVLVGSSDLGMFNPWTIGKVRYIDRDNAKGTFVSGGTDDGAFGYVGAMIALPKLFVGPGWTTGVADPTLRNPFWSRDWAYGLKLTYEDYDVGNFRAIATLTHDSELDIADPDAPGTLYPDCKDALGDPIAGCISDHGVETISRYTNVVATFQYDHVLFDDILSVDALFGVSHSDVNPEAAANGVADNQGVFPIVFDDVFDWASVVRLELMDPFEVGLSFKLEGFSIGEHWSSIFAARREADVLLTDGFISGGQLPTLNLANEFVDFDEPWYESCIGWYGVTLVPVLELDEVTLEAEGTYIGYHTNAQERDVDSIYPDFLHTDGFTDTDLYDYANKNRRGRDPRSVYRRNQDRQTVISRLNMRIEPDLDFELGIDLGAKLIYDLDGRSLTTEADDYEGLRIASSLAMDVAVGDALRLGGGAVVEWWHEENRAGTLEQGYGLDETLKVRAFLSAIYVWSGFNFAYRLEYVHKEQTLERDPDQLWGVLRSKATLEVLW